MRIVSVHLTFVEAPQIEPLAPYRSHLRTSSTTRSAIVRVDTNEGHVGWGEYNINFLPDANPIKAMSDAEWAIGRDPLNLTRFHATCPLQSRLKSGLELALWDIRGKALGQSVAEMLGGVIRPHVAVAACMGIHSYDESRRLAAWHVEQGFTTLKMKGGGSIDEDVAMIRGVRDGDGGLLRLRLDPNCAYSREEAAELARRLAPFDLEYLEQPILAEPLADATWLRLRSSIPIALNESVVGPESAIEIIRSDAAAIILPDTHIAGGIQPCVEIGQIAAAAGIPCVMHCGHDLGPKTAAMLHVAAACPAYSLPNDTTYYGLKEDVLAEPFVIEDGRIEVPTGPGLGITMDEEKLARLAVATD